MCKHQPSLECQLFVESILRNKAVADGAVSFCIDHYVTARVSKFALGINCYIPYDTKNPEHTSRSPDKFVGLDGNPKIDGLFSNILPMVNFTYSVVLILYTESSNSRALR